MNRRKFIQSAALTTTAVSATSASALQAKQPEHAKRKRYQNGATRWPICLDTATLSKELSLKEKSNLRPMPDLMPSNHGIANCRNTRSPVAASRIWAKKFATWVCMFPVLLVSGVHWLLQRNFQPGNRGAQEAVANDFRYRFRACPGNSKIRFERAFGQKGRCMELQSGLRNGQGVRPKACGHFLEYGSGLSLSDATAIALDSDQTGSHDYSGYLPHVSGGTDSHALGRLRGDFIAIFQFADAGKDVEPILHKGVDSQRVLPGDVKIDLKAYLTNLKKTGFDGCVSLELYNQVSQP